jgi:hypothetical protein
VRPNHLLFLLLLILGTGLFAQETDAPKKEVNDMPMAVPDSLKFKANTSLRKQRLIADPLTPAKAAFYSAVLPGLGQIYVGKAWKVPIVYGALGASIYYYVTNDKELNKYRTAYKRRNNGFFDDEYLENIPEQETLLLGLNFHKNYRDIALILAAAAYMLNILDANVSAHLLQFNVSNDLSFNPNIIMDSRQTGLSLSIKF